MCHELRDCYVTVASIQGFLTKTLKFSENSGEISMNLGCFDDFWCIFFDFWVR